MTTDQEIAIKMLGFAAILLYTVDNGYDVENDDDLKDAMVEMTMDDGHFTDEQLDASVKEFREFQEALRA